MNEPEFHVEHKRRPYVHSRISRAADFPGLPSNGVELTVTRQGIELTGWYDHFAGIEGYSIPWADFDRIRAEVEGKGA